MSKQLNSLTRFVAFYSYKGGVGRTLALANCARALAAKGKKVVLLDFDLEAPGLLHFPVFQVKNNNRPQGFSEYIDSCLKNGAPENLDNYIHECKGKEDDQGKTWLMPAGRHKEASYLNFLKDMSWSEFYSKQDGYKILENLRGHIIEQYAPDYVFIDSRTGSSEIAGIATQQMADIVVLIFNLNEQNLDGAKRIFGSISKSPLKPSIILTASPVPVVPMDKGTPFYKKMQRIKKDFSGAYNNKDPLIIPYHPLLAFDDRLLVDDGDLFGSDASYRRLAEIIQKVAVVDADVYLQLMTKPMQQGDWTAVINIAEKGLANNVINIYLFFNLVRAYFFADKFDKVIATVDSLLLHFGDTQKAVFHKLVAEALFVKAVVLYELEQANNAIACYNKLIQKFGNSTELALQEQVAKAFLNKGIVLGELEQTDNAIACYNELIQKFGSSSELVLQEVVAKVFFNKGVLLGKLEQTNNAIDCYNELIQKFGSSSELALQEVVAKAFFYKGAGLGILEQIDNAVACYNELIQKFGNSLELVLQEIVAKAFYYKGAALGKLEQTNNAIACYNELIQKFGNSTELVIQEQVVNALNGKGFALLLKAKKTNTKHEKQKQLLDATNNFDLALTYDIKPEIQAMVLGNQAYSLFLLGQKQESEQILKKALILGGKKTYEYELADSKITPLSEDEAFRELLERLWQQIQVQ